VRKKTLGLRAEACNFRSCGLKGLEPCARILHLYLDVQLRARVFPVVELRRQTLEGLDLTMVGDPLLSSLRAGDRLDLVVQVINTELTGITLRTQWHSELCRCTGSLACSLESGMVLTLYGAQYQGRYGTSHHIGLPPDAYVIPRPNLDGDSFRCFKEVCAGIGGMTAGCTLLGGTSYAVMDNSPLACETLNMQPTTVVAGDISDPQARRQLHFIQANTRCMLGASLPGPGCCRDLASGFSVQGCPLLCHVLQAAWHMQASGVILECELNLLDNQQCAAWLREFAIKAGFHQAQVVLDLAQQWSARRVR